MSSGDHTQARVTPQDVQRRLRCFLPLLEVLVVVATAPYRRTFKLYTWVPLRAMRAAGHDRCVTAALVKDFKLDKYAELQSVQVAASFCAGATLASLSWSRNQQSVWAADALWFCSLSCSVWAVITSIQVKSIVDDLPRNEQLNSALSDGELQRMRRTVLRYTETPGIGHWIMMVIWQFPSMTMSYAWTTFLAGLTIFVCSPFLQHVPWGPRHKIAIIYLAIGSTGLAAYISSSVFVYRGERDFERSVACTRANSDLEATSTPKLDERLGQRYKKRSAPSYPPESSEPVRVTESESASNINFENEHRTELAGARRDRRRLLI